MQKTGAGHKGWARFCQASVRHEQRLHNRLCDRYHTPCSCTTRCDHGRQDRNPDLRSHPRAGLAGRAHSPQTDRLNKRGRSRLLASGCEVAPMVLAADKTGSHQKSPANARARVQSWP